MKPWLGADFYSCDLYDHQIKLALKTEKKGSKVSLTEFMKEFIYDILLKFVNHKTLLFWKFLTESL